MKWDRDNQSSDVEDRRGQPMRAGGGGIGFLLPLFLRFGWKGALVGVGLLLLLRTFSGTHPLSSPTEDGQKAGRDEVRAFVGSVLDDVQNTWKESLGDRYRSAHVVLYTAATETGCGFGQAAVGPFYCPRDQKVYLDVSFFRQLHDRFGAPGDFAQAYVIAHELGHHVQRQLGVTATAERAALAQQKGESGVSVRIELQADCYAGVWARSAQRRGLLEPGDVEAAMRAAAAVGDDRLQRQATGTVRPESWTHGSSEERTRWFQRGMQMGRAESCDTFAAPTL